MLEEKVKEILKEKSKNALLVIAENIGTKGYSGLTKPKLLEKLFNDYDNHPSLLSELGIKNQKKIIKQIVKSFFIIVLTALIGVLIKHYFFPSASKEDIQVIEDKIDKNELYRAEIEHLEKYKRKFLNDEMPITYKVFGMLNGKFVMKEQLVNNSIRTNYQSSFSSDFENNEVTITLLMKEFELGQETNKLYLYDLNLEQTFPLVEDNPFDFNLGKWGGQVIRFILLKSDREQPIFAIGIGKD